MGQINEAFAPIPLIGPVPGIKMGGNTVYSGKRPQKLYPVMLQSEGKSPDLGYCKCRDVQVMGWSRNNSNHPRHLAVGPAS